MKKSAILLMAGVFILLFGQGLFNSSLARDSRLTRPTKQIPEDIRSGTTSPKVGQSHLVSCESMAAEVATEEACCEAQ